MDQGIVGSQSTGATEEDDDIEEQFKELCDAAGVAPGDVYRPAPQLPRAEDGRKQFSSASAGGR
eukprot:7388047-Prymnesium_polylepis.3